MSSGKAGLAEEGAPRGPRQAGDKQALDSRGGLRTLNRSPRLEGWPEHRGTAPAAGLPTRRPAPALGAPPSGNVGSWRVPSQASDDRGQGPAQTSRAHRCHQRLLVLPECVCPEGQGRETQGFRACLRGVRGVRPRAGPCTLGPGPSSLMWGKGHAFLTGSG